MDAAPVTRRLWLVRHAEAQLETEAGNDHARTLTRRGTREAKRAADHFAMLGWLPELILSSSAARARQTAEIIARRLELPARKLQVLDSLYLADPHDLRTAVGDIGPRIAALMLVAHNPGISAFAQQLAPAAAMGSFETAGIGCFDFDAQSWPLIDFATLRASRYEATR